MYMHNQQSPCISKTLPVQEILPLSTASPEPPQDSTPMASGHWSTLGCVGSGSIIWLNGNGLTAPKVDSTAACAHSGTRVCIAHASPCKSMPVLQVTSPYINILACASRRSRLRKSTLYGFGIVYACKMHISKLPCLLQCSSLVAFPTFPPSPSYIRLTERSLKVSCYLVFWHCALCLYQNRYSSRQIKRTIDER